MNVVKAALFASMLATVADGWAQQTAAATDEATQLRALRQQLATMRKQLAAARSELSAQASARQELQVQLSALQAQQADLNTVRQQLDQLKAEVKALKANTVLDLNGYLGFDVSNGYPTALFRGINVQIVNGTGDTQTVNGMGNLIVGYNRASTGAFTCSIGAAESQEACAAIGGVWAQSHKGGSHNIVGGDFNNYSSWGGLVLGLENSLSAPYAAIIAGARNHAGASFASISAGSYNTASGIYSSVSAGFANRASGEFSAVGGGANRAAPAKHSWTAGTVPQDNNNK